MPAALVLLLYLLLLHDVLSHFWPATPNSAKTPTVYRPKSQTPEVKAPKSLDSLWRRMKAASQHYHSLGVNHDVITSAMAEARKQRYVDRMKLGEDLDMD